MRRVRPVDIARLSLGLAAVLRPDAVLSLAGSTTSSATPRRTVRLLGSRYLLQSGAGVVDARPWLPKIDGAIDLAHAGSMVLAAWVWPDHRRLTLLSAAVAVGFAGLDLTEQVG